MSNIFNFFKSYYAFQYCQHLIIILLPLSLSLIFFYRETIIHTITTKNKSYFILKVREVFSCNFILIYEYIELRRLCIMYIFAKIR